MRKISVIAVAIACLMGSAYGAKAADIEAGLVPLELTEAAVVSGGVVATGPITTVPGSGITKLPAGTQLVSQAGNTAILLPGMIGMPMGLQGCNVAVIGNTELSALSLIGTSTFVASLPMEAAQTRTFSQVTTKRVIAKPAHKIQRRVIHHRRQVQHRVHLNPALRGS